MEESERAVASPSPEAPPVTTADIFSFISIDHLTMFFYFTIQIISFG
jgi:hypothetical protein